jgi:hypothetical protein
LEKFVVQARVTNLTHTANTPSFCVTQNFVPAFEVISHWNNLFFSPFYIEKNLLGDRFRGHRCCMLPRPKWPMNLDSINISQLKTLKIDDKLRVKYDLA